MAPAGSRTRSGYSLRSAHSKTSVQFAEHTCCFTYFSVTSPASLLTQSTVSTLSTFSSNQLSADSRAFLSLTCDTTFGMALALERDAMLRINCEAVMWKITTRGFTLEEALIMAVMNLLTSADTAAKRGKRASQKSKGDQA